MKNIKILGFVRKHIIIILVAVIVIFCFYFFAVRPGQIRSDCYYKSIYGNKYEGSDGRQYNDNIPIDYTSCLHANGLDK